MNATEAQGIDFEKEASERAGADLDLWTRWNDQGRPPALTEELFGRFRPLMKSKEGTFTGKGLQIPPAAISAEVSKLTLKAFETYNPNKGAALGTHVFNTLHSINRYVATHQNFARIPETRIFRVGDLQRARAVLDARDDREPTDKELARYLKWPVSQVTTLKREVRRDLTASQFPTDLSVFQPSRLRAAVTLVRKELRSQRDRDILDRLTKDHKVRQMAQELRAAGHARVSPSSVSRAKTRILKQLKAHLEG